MNPKKSDIIPNVRCDVSLCKYNTLDRSCCAEKISVENERAQEKAETFCSTFCPRGISG